MRRTVGLAAASLIFLAPFLWTVDDAWARAGRGGSSGSRGSRSHSAPAHSSSSATSSPAKSDTASNPTPAPPTPSGGSGFGGMIGGLIAGGLIGSLLFGGGGGGGFGFTELAVLGVLAFMLIRKMRSPQPEPAVAVSHSRAVATRLDTRDAAPWGESESAGQTRRPEPAVDGAEVTRNVTDVFLKVQAAWTARDLDPAAAMLTPEMRAQLQADCDRMKAQGRINRIENVTVRNVEVTETWQDPGYNFMTVRIEASLFDYTVDEKTGEVLEGSATEAVTFQEYWTFTRAVWVKAWRLSAIQQATA